VRVDSGFATDRSIPGVLLGSPRTLAMQVVLTCTFQNKLFVRKFIWPSDFPRNSPKKAVRNHLFALCRRHHDICHNLL
jgi:hypothetical protein